MSHYAGVLEGARLPIVHTSFFFQILGNMHIHVFSKSHICRLFKEPGFPKGREMGRLSYEVPLKTANPMELKRLPIVAA